MNQTRHDFMVKAGLPGLTTNDVHIKVTGDVLTIHGEVKQQDKQKEKAWHLREHRWGIFERAVMLPVVSDQANAEFENGILTITLPKAEEVKPTAIIIKGK